MKKAGLVNLGQLVREQQGKADTVLVGFGSYRGEVIAGSEWGAPMKKMEVPQGREIVSNSSCMKKEPRTSS